MIRVTLTGKHNASFVVKNQKKIEMWKMLNSHQEMNVYVHIQVEELQ